MSRVGNNPIQLPKGVEVTLGEMITVKGPLGSLSQKSPENVRVVVEAGVVSFEPVDETIQANAMSGTLRALMSNMVNGVSKGFEKKLTLVGVGYRAQAQGAKLNLTLGFSHPVVLTPPPFVKFEVNPRANTVTVEGIDKEVVGRLASEIRGWRPVDPYLGKGVRYLNEVVRRKAGKTGKA